MHSVQGQNLLYDFLMAEPAGNGVGIKSDGGSERRAIHRRGSVLHDDFPPPRWREVVMSAQGIVDSREKIEIIGLHQVLRKKLTVCSFAEEADGL